MTNVLSARDTQLTGACNLALLIRSPQTAEAEAAVRVRDGLEGEKAREGAGSSSAWRVALAPRAPDTHAPLWLPDLTMAQAATWLIEGDFK